jgi:hypothetical protein
MGCTRPGTDGVANTGLETAMKKSKIEAVHVVYIANDPPLPETIVRKLKLSDGTYHISTAELPVSVGVNDEDFDYSEVQKWEFGDARHADILARRYSVHVVTRQEIEDGKRKYVKLYGEDLMGFDHFA